VKFFLQRSVNNQHPLDGIIHGGKSRGIVMEVLIEGIVKGVAEFVATEVGTRALQTFGRDGLLIQIGLSAKKKDAKALFPRTLHERIAEILKKQSNAS
jgi:hypothetical protein